MNPKVVLINPHFPHNLAAAIRACACFDVDELLWTGDRMKIEFGERLPREERMKGYSSVKFYPHERPLDHLQGSPICVEIHPGSTPLPTFVHPADAIYVFGPEDGSVPPGIRRLCHRFVHIPAKHCLNLAAAINVVLYDRVQKSLDWLDLHPAEIEQRGCIEVEGWDGK